MDWEKTEGQQMIEELARDTFARAGDDQRYRRALDGWDRPTWAALAETGLLAATIPEAAGGGGMGFLELVSLLIEAGRAAAPVPLLPTLGFAATPLARTLPDHPRLGEVAAGEAALTGAYAEAGRRDPLRPATAARHIGDTWRLTGIKHGVPALTHATAAVVSATGDDGPALFLVATDDAERRIQPATGDRSAGELHLVDTPAVRLGGPEALAAALDTAWVATAAVQLGIARGALLRTAEYVTGRHQFGVPVGTFQAVSQRAADAYIDVEVMEVTLWRAAARLHHGLPARREVRIARATACEGAHKVLAAAQHLHGGMGFDRDYPLHRYWLQGKQLEFTLGGATEHLAALGAELAEAAR